jgi:hypothetical protein
LDDESHPSSTTNLVRLPPDYASSIRFLSDRLHRPITIPSFSTMSHGEMFCKWEGDKKTTTYIATAAFHCNLSSDSRQDRLTKAAGESWGSMSEEDSIIDVAFKGHESLNADFSVRGVSVDDTIEPVIFQSKSN